MSKYPYMDICETDYGSISIPEQLLSKVVGYMVHHFVQNWPQRISNWKYVQTLSTILWFCIFHAILPFLQCQMSILWGKFSKSGTSYNQHLLIKVDKGCLLNHSLPEDFDFFLNLTTLVCRFTTSWRACDLSFCMQWKENTRLGKEIFL